MIDPIIAVIFFIICDRFLKSLALINAPISQQNILGDIFQFNLAKNYNIAFSLPLSGYFLKLILVIIILGLTYCFIILCINNKYNHAGWLLFVIFGATSNLVDRIKYGYVIDYFDLKYFTVFNLADVLIIIGIVGLFYLSKKDYPE
ncbi:MAG: signal peptidase II [Patescibacteria group bacterium]|nr:signal peptidase II [Patescibacteria group bacterium]